MQRVRKMTEGLIEEALEVAELFRTAAQQLRRLGRGPFKSGYDSLSSRHIYRFAGKIKFSPSFPHDVCFETANRLEEFAATLQILVRPEPFQS